MKVFLHHIYEYQKGIRNLVLHTLPAIYKDNAELLLQRKNISYFIQMPSKDKVNIFFGNTDCVNVVKQFCNKPLNELNNEEDFILGILLGYNQIIQCKRFLNRVEKKEQAILIDNQCVVLY